jgi:hypothetical protein
MGHNGDEVMRVAIAQKERHTPGRSQLSDLMEHGLGHGQGAFLYLDAQPPFALGINWLRVLGTAELAQIDQRVCQQLHAIMPLLYTFKAEQESLEFIFPCKGALDAHPQRMDGCVKEAFTSALGRLAITGMALVGFQGRGYADGVQLNFCHALLLETLIFQ